MYLFIAVLSVGVHTTKGYWPAVITKALLRSGMLSLDQKQDRFRYFFHEKVVHEYLYFQFHAASDWSQTRQTQSQGKRQSCVILFHQICPYSDTFGLKSFE